MKTIILILFLSLNLFAQGRKFSILMGDAPHPVVNGYSFDGETQYATVANNAVLNFGTNAFSFEMNIRIHSNLAAEYIFGKRQTDNIMYTLNYNGSVPELHFYIVLAGTTVIRYRASVTAFNPTDWHHIVISGDRTQGVMYLDGSPIPLNRGNTNNDASDITNTGNLQLATYNSGGLPFTGGNIDMSLFRVYNKALSAPEVTTLYNAGNPQGGVSGTVLDLTGINATPTTWFDASTTDIDATITGATLIYK